MGNKLSREFRVGLFGIVVIIALYLGINYIQNNRIFSSDRVLYGIFSKSDGLEASAPVISKGFRVGTVEKVDMNMKTGKIVVTFSVRGEYPLTTDSKIKISSSSLLGGKVIEVMYGSQPSCFKNHDTIPSVEEPAMMDFVMSEYAVLREKLASYSVKVDSILSGMDRIMSKQNTDNIARTLENVRKLSSSLSLFMSANSSDLTSLVSNLDSLSSSLASAGPSLQSAIGKINNASDSLPQLIANANNAVSSLSSILKKVDSRDGNLGKLVNDDELYNSITATVQSLDSLLVDLKEHPKRYINVTVFGKKEKSE